MTTSQIKALIFTLIGLVALGAGLYVAYSLKDAGRKEVQLENQQQATKTVEVEKGVAQKNTTVAKRKVRTDTTNKAKAEKALKEIEDAAAQERTVVTLTGLPAPGAAPVFTADELRRFNDPLGDASPAGGHREPAAVRDQPAGAP